MSGNAVVILAPCLDIIETLGLSPLNLSLLNFISFGCSILILLSDKLADETDLVFLVVLLWIPFQFFQKPLIYPMNLIYPMT